MEIGCITEILNQNYALHIVNIELFREGGNLAYVVQDADKSYFLKIIRPPFYDNALNAIEIQLYLMKNAFPVIPIAYTKKGTAYVATEINGEKKIFVLYEYIEGTEPLPADTEAVGALIGRLHSVMQNFTGTLPVHNKHFFIDRYVEIMRKKGYDKAQAFQVYGNELWERVKNLPRGYCHCDLYRGNIHRDSAGKLRVMDFDTSCFAFPMYDVVLFCNDTHWFNFEYDGYEKSKVRLEQFLQGYLKHYSLSKEEIAAFYDFIAVYHFQLQANMMEIYGYDCVGIDYFDKQYDWLMKWENQCTKMRSF